MIIYIKEGKVVWVVLDRVVMCQLVVVAKDIKCEIFCREIKLVESGEVERVCISVVQVGIVL